MTIEDNIKKTRNLKASSIKTYTTSLKKISKILDPKNENLENTNFLKDFKKVMEIVNKEEKITSKKNKLTAIIVALDSDDKKDVDLINKFNNELTELGNKYLTFLKQQKKTQTQTDNWIDYNELIKIANDIMSDIKHKNINKKDELNKKEFDLLQQMVILRTYIAFPLRNDFSDMKIMLKKDYNKLNDDEKNLANYLIIAPKNKKYFYINQFKNQKFIGNKVLEIQPKLNKVVNLWLKHNKSGWFLVKSDRKTPMNPNGITKYLNKIFMKHCQKKISTSMIRHIVISNVLKDKPSIIEREEEEKAIEDKFLHNKNMNDLYRKIDDASDDL